MHAVEVRDHIMIAHSFRGDVFGPAQKLHGATFVVDAAFIAETLDTNGIVVDIGRAHEALKAVLKDLNYRNLDDIAEFKGKNTTTEFLTRHIFDRLAKAARAGELGRPARELKAIRVTVSESHVARAWYEAALTRELVFALPGDIDIPTGGYIYDRRIVEGLRALGWRVDALKLGEGFPFPAEAVRREAARRLAAAAPERTLVVDGLAFGILPDAAEVLKASHRVVALVHHPLALETGLPDEQASAFAESEKRALAHARHVIVTSAATANILWTDFGIDESRISVVRPGIDRALPAGPKAPRDKIALLAVGSIVPRKGYPLLIDALARLADLPWMLTIAGDRSRDPAEAARLDEAIRRQGLGARISVLGAVGPEKIAALYRDADLFVLPSHFEGYGMAFAEALANGLPVIGARAGATPDTVPEDAGILVPPGDVASLEAALRLLIGDAKARERLAAGARRAARDLPDWPETAKLFAAVIEAKG